MAMFSRAYHRYRPLIVLLQVQNYTGLPSSVNIDYGCTGLVVFILVVAIPADSLAGFAAVS